MVTRAEQIAEAERIARDNPEWTKLGAADLINDLTEAFVWPSDDGVWFAQRGPDEGGQTLLEDFDSPAAAIRALGYPLNKGTNDG
ncbi:MAG TPA: hypothetical protein VFJ16_08275 [Longimicrobium sp.]|nr:hypothetical protein [Longimicrobium sp.]